MCSSGDFGPLHWIPCHAGTKLTIAAEAAHFACSIPNLACHENPAALSRVSESICNNQAAVPLSGSQAEQTSSTCDNCRERISALLWGQPSISAVAATIPGLCHAEPWSENVAKTRGEGPPWASLRRCLQHAQMMCCPSDSRLSDAWLSRC